MLVVINSPRTELSISGAGAAEVLEELKKRFAVNIVAADPADLATRQEQQLAANSDDELVDLNDTEWWRKNHFRVLTGCRKRHHMTQQQLADKTGIPKTVISAYENGKRSITPKAAKTLADALGTYPEKFLPDIQ